MSLPRARIVVALRCEAKPLVDAFDLERVRRPARSPCSDWFENDAMVLVVGGVGRVQMARAVGALHALLGERLDRPWLNVGVAGGRERLPGVAALYGEAVLAAQVIDDSVERANARLREADSAAARPGVKPLPAGVASFHPPQTVRGDLTAAIVRTVDAAELRYEKPGLHEMEATAFVQAAAPLATAELVQVLKVTSDTPDQPLHDLNAKAIEALIEDALPAVAGVVERLRDLASSRSEPTSEHSVDAWLSSLGRDVAEAKWTFTRRQQLRSLLDRWAALGPSQGNGEEEPLPPPGVVEPEAVLEWLREALRQAPPRLPERERGRT